MVSTNLSSLPPEVLRQTALYLPLPDIHSLLLAGPRCFRELRDHTIDSPSFAPWRKRFSAYQRLYIRTTREARRQACGVDVQGHITTGGQNWPRTALEYELEGMTRTVAGELGLLPSAQVDARTMVQGPGNPPVLVPKIRLKMVFYALKHLSATKLGHLRLLPLLCPLSKITDILTQKYSPLELVQKLVCVPLLPQSSSPPGSIAGTAAIYRIITAYLLFTALTPNDILGVLLDASLADGRDIYAVRGEQEMALVEYFHFLRLFLLIHEYDKTLRFRGVTALGVEVMSPQGGRILMGRLDVWIRGYFRPERPLPPPSSLALSMVRNDLVQNICKNSTPVGSQLKRASSMGSGSHSSGLGRETSFGPTPEPYYLGPLSSDNPGPALTKEQERIVRTDVISGDLMKVRAYAGTGKTMSLIEYAKTRPHQRFLYIAFNKSAQLDAEKKFPCNVDCKTMHSIAFRALNTYAPQIRDSLPDFNKTIKDRRLWDGRMPTMEIPSSSFTSRHVIEMLQLENNTAMITSALINPSLYSLPGSRKKKEEEDDGKMRFPTANVVASCVKKTLERYWSSKNLELSRNQLPLKMIWKLGLNSDVLFKWAENLWEGMVAGKVRYVPHDAYLKLFHLDGVQQAETGVESAHGGLVRGGGDMAAFGQYDVIMFDEAQDSNPSMADVILRQRPWAGLLIVGDPYQKIYGFRGATNECFDDAIHVPTHLFYLTHSFRFGDKIAEVANVFLRALDETVGVNGVRREDSVRRSLPNQLEMALGSSKEVQLLEPGEIEGGGSGKYTVIFRKNITLVEYALKYCISHSHLHHRIALNTAKNFNKSPLFTLLRAAYQLFHEKKAARTGILAGYKDWLELTEHVKAEASEEGSLTTDSPGLGLVVGLEEYIEKKDFLHTITTCENMVTDRSDEADVILVTAHQAKGQEWDRVVVADDFGPSYGHRELLGVVKYYEEEIFMTYVAVTRAKKELIVGSGIAAWLAGEMGAYRFYLSSLQGERKCLDCCYRMADTQDEIVGDVQPRAEAVLMGYECLLLTGSFGAKITGLVAENQLWLVDRKDAFICSLCVRWLGPGGLLTRNAELAGTCFQLMLALEVRCTVSQSSQSGVSIKSLSERLPLSVGYNALSKRETLKVLGWVAGLEDLIVKYRVLE